MKNDEQMYQSVLSRRDAYRAKKEQRIRTVRRTVPLLACCCLAAVLGIGYRKYLNKLPAVPVVPESSDVAVTVSPVTTAATFSEPAGSVTAPVTTAAQTAITKAASEKSAQTATVTAARETLPADPETPAPVTQIPQTTQTVPVTEPPVTTAVPPETAEPVLTTESESQKPSQNPGDPVHVQAQPLTYPDIQAAADAVKAGDLSAYELREKYQYRAMFDRMLIDGFLYQVSNANGITRQETRGITLLPDADYEDIGVSCRVQYQGQSYYVAFCYALRITLSTLKNTEIPHFFKC